MRQQLPRLTMIFSVNPGIRRTSVRPWFNFGLLLMTLAACVGCSTKAENTTPPPPPGVTVTPVIQKDAPIYQEWVGTMAGNVDADIRPKVSGFLLAQLYQEGSYLNKGQPMFQLDQRETQAVVAQAQGELERALARLHQAQVDVDRYTPLVAQKAVSQAELDKALSMKAEATGQINANQAILDNAKLDVGWTTVTSPISGIAGVSKVQIGDLMSPNSVMTTVSSVNPIFVDFSIAEQDYLRFVREKTGRAAGQSVELILGDASVYPERGHLNFVNREVDSRTGTIQIRAEFPNPGNVLRPGQYARIRAVTELRKDALLIPQQAVSELQGIYQVGVVASDNTATIKSVKLGPQFGDMWVVEEGLKAGDNVVVDGLQRIKNGMTVSPTPFKDTQADASLGGH